MNDNLKALLQRQDIWRCSDIAKSAGACIPSGFAELDEHLPGGGWPLGALTEVLLPQEGIGELRLFMPALVRLNHHGQWLAWVAPPYIPYAPALAAWGIDLTRTLIVRPRNREDGLWAVEQALRAGLCGAVLAWLDREHPGGERKRDHHTAQRRLQLAAETGQCMGLLFGNADRAQHPSPAALRLRLERTPEGIAVQILKRRGGRPVSPITVRLEHVVVHSSAPPSPGHLLARHQR